MKASLPVADPNLSIPHLLNRKMMILGVITTTETFQWLIKSPDMPFPSRLDAWGNSPAACRHNCDDPKQTTETHLQIYWAVIRLLMKTNPRISRTLPPPSEGCKDECEELEKNKSSSNCDWKVKNKEAKCSCFLCAKSSTSANRNEQLNRLLAKLPARDLNPEQFFSGCFREREQLSATRRVKKGKKRLLSSEFSLVHEGYSNWCSWFGQTASKAEDQICIGALQHEQI